MGADTETYSQTVGREATQLKMSIGPLPLELGELHGRGEGGHIGDRGVNETMRMRHKDIN